MLIYVGLDKDGMSLYGIHINLNNFAVILHILLHVIICVTGILITNCLRYNVQLNIWYCKKSLTMLDCVNFGKIHALSSMYNNCTYGYNEYACKY